MWVFQGTRRGGFYHHFYLSCTASNVKCASRSSNTSCCACVPVSCCRPLMDIYIRPGVHPDSCHAHTMAWGILLTFLSVISVSVLPLPIPNELSLSISEDHNVFSLVGLPSFGGDSGTHHRVIHLTGFGISTSGPVWCQTSDHCCLGMFEDIILTSSLY